MDIIDIPTLKEFVKDVVIGLEEPVMIVGETGCGKSEGIAQAVEEADAILCDIRLGQYDSVDMRGFPGVDKTTGLTVWHAPSTLPFVGNDLFPDDKTIVLFLDELTSATPSGASASTSSNPTCGSSRRATEPRTRASSTACPSRSPTA